jgi:hypothetical protein
MTERSPCPGDVTSENHGAGMGRFYNVKNLNRYRKLASGAIDVAERYEIIKALTQELNAFKRGARTAAVKRP